jgi:curved DNA-binding protein CbpA
LPHLLVNFLERQLSGSCVLRSGNQTVTLMVSGGFPAKIQTSELVCPLGALLVELQMLPAEALPDLLAERESRQMLLGALLLEKGLIDEMRLQGALRLQLDRKLEYAGTLPHTGTFEYFDGFDALAGYGGPELLQIDPLRALWAGVARNPAWDHVSSTLSQVGGASLRFAQAAQPERFGFQPELGPLVLLLRTKPCTVHELMQQQVVPQAAVQLFVFCLVATKQIELVAAQAQPIAPGVSVAPPQPLISEAPPAMPGSNPTVPVPAYANAPVTNPDGVPTAPPPMPAIPTQGVVGSIASASQAFARMKLQSRAVVRAVVAEEVVAVRNPADERIASPLPQRIDLPAYKLHAPAPPIVPGNVSPPPPPSAPPVPSSKPAVAPPAPVSKPAVAPPAPVSKPAVAPPAPVSSPAAAAPLSKEHEQLKKDIEERAAKCQTQNFFEMLGLSKEATREEVQKAYFGLAKTYHPDRLPPALSSVKDACATLFAKISEAQATLTDNDKRIKYLRLVQEGGATADEQNKVQAILEAATDFQKAEVCLKRNDPAQAEQLVRKAHAADPEQSDYLALLTWLEAQKPEFTSRDKTLEKIKILDGAINRSPKCERAYFYRGMLYKRIDEPGAAIKDFREASELNPRNVDAQREVRLHNMRKTGDKAGKSIPPGARGAATKDAGGLFGKLFKK